MWQSAAFIASLQVKTRWEIDVKTFFSVFNDLIICVQPVKTWFQRSSHQGCVVYVVAAISARTLTAVAPRAPSHYDEMTAPRRPNCFRFVFIPRSAARLLLVSPLLAAIGPAACVRLCLSGATAALQRPGQADQSHHQSEETRAKTAGKCVPTSPPPPPTHKQNKKQQLHDGEKVTALIDSYWGGEDSELHNSYHKSTKRIYGNSRLCIRVSNSLTDRVCSGYSKMIVLVWLHAYRVAPADLTVISLLIPIPIHYESSSDSATLCLIILTERAAFICKLNCIAIIFFFAKTCSSSHPNLRIVFNSPDFDDCNVSSLKLTAR